ncbi:hypothetical protein SAMN05443245_1143 [Paraburkholderia fungorum]|uniref:Uncharacterized protein n=1 Tax=Paraburkholderia fungorum TaxID=134537 RepID=A0A1H1ADR9_9BURK|nr:hypothetical protein SAMN05443245_1143 [Paraburkholderia fungorum]
MCESPLSVKEDVNLSFISYSAVTRAESGADEKSNVENHCIADSAIAALTST